MHCLFHEGRRDRDHMVVGVRFLLRRGVLNKLCDKVCLWFLSGHSGFLHQ